MTVLVSETDLKLTLLPLVTTSVDRTRNNTRIADF
jgi:hypothetical protein